MNTNERRMKRILLVSDTLFSHMTLCELLEKNGYEVKTAENVGQALSMLEELSVDLVITDLAMAKLSGVDLITSMKKRNALGEIPVIVLVFPWDANQTMAIKGKGAFAVLTLPYSQENLLSLVANAQQGKALEQNSNSHQP